MEHIERLRAWEEIDLPKDLDKRVHQNRLLKIAREGAPMTAADLAKFEPQRRYATLAALAIEGRATVIDEIIDLHDRVVGKMFQMAKHSHEQQFQESGKPINNQLRLYGQIGQALVEAKKTGGDPFAAIESVLSWDAFEASVTQARKLAQPEDFDFLHRVGESHTTLRRYAPAFLNVLQFHAAPAAKDLLDGVEALRGMYEDQDRKIPADAPSAFIKQRWKKLAVVQDGFDRRYYELCLLSELKNALRSSDIWVEGSRQFKDFEEYLLPVQTFSDLQKSNALPLAVEPDCERYLKQRTALLDEQVAAVSRLAAANGLPEAAISDSGLKLTPLETSVPSEADALIERAALLLPHVKITELLEEVDRWIGFTRHFTHAKSRLPAGGK